MANLTPTVASVATKQRLTAYVLEDGLKRDTIVERLVEDCQEAGVDEASVALINRASVTGMYKHYGIQNLKPSKTKADPMAGLGFGIVESATETGEEGEEGENWED